jgi:ribosomal-protein-alanine N-acetyltransferase
VPEDADALVALERESFPHPWTRAQVAAELRHPAALGLVAEEAGAIVGYALFRRVLDEAELLRLAVVPSRRRGGIARAMVARGTTDLAARGCVVLFLEVREDNEGAIAFYERLGWTGDGRRPGYFPDGAAALLYRLGTTGPLPWR